MCSANISSRLRIILTHKKCFPLKLKAFLRVKLLHNLTPRDVFRCLLEGRRRHSKKQKWVRGWLSRVRRKFWSCCCNFHTNESVTRIQILLFNEMAIIHIEILTFKFTKSRLYMGFLKWFCALRKQFLRNFVLYYLADRSQLLIVKQNFCNYEITSKSFICFWSDFIISKIQERHWYSSQESSCQCENRTQIAGMIVLSCWVMYLQI